MKSDKHNERSTAGLWRWLAIIAGVNVLLVVLGFFVPASDEQVYVAAVQHLMRSEGLTTRNRRPTVAYIQTEEPLSADARDSLTRFASSANLYLRWVNGLASMALEAERNIENGGYLFTLGPPRHGFVSTTIDTETHVVMGGGRAQLVLYHWMGVSEVWGETELPWISLTNP